MEERIREIVAGFIRVPAGEIGPSTPIDRSAVKSSIVLHRMYARLADEGCVVEGYTSIRVFGDLLAKAAASSDAGEAARPDAASPADFIQPAAAPDGPADHPDRENTAIGIDIEEIAGLPRTADFRRDNFYKMNFTPREIAWCILQPDPYASFAGLFAVKEAMVKADPAVRNQPFHSLEIGHTAEGKPLTPGFAISISHAGGTAVAVATRNPAPIPVLSAAPATQPAVAGTKAPVWPAWLAIGISVITLLIVLLH